MLNPRNCLAILALIMAFALGGCMQSEPQSAPAPAPAPTPEPAMIDVEETQSLALERGTLEIGKPLHKNPAAMADQSNIAVPQAIAGVQAMSTQAYKRRAAISELTLHGSYPHRPVIRQLPPTSAENYAEFKDHQVQWATQNPVSTFAVDVDTAAYANVRRMLNSGHLPPRDAVRVEEFLNYFPYDYALPENNTVPFSLHTELGSSPWDERKRLLHIGIQGWKPAADEAMPAANLVFLIDVSGSMRAPNKIGLLKSAMKMLGRQLRSQDRLAIAVYAGASGEVLAPTSGAEYAKIEAAIDSLNPGGSTNGGAGIELAYRLAQQGFVKGGINRVILATDGDFNVGVTDPKQLEQMIERKRKDGVALSVLGFGSGNYNDALMQKLAQIGDGNAAYIDTMNEARKVLVDELGSTLNIIAKDMKVQIEFNPAIVDTYRLVGYETRKLNREDFNNDAVDAGEIGAGHSVTALYELTLVGDADAGAGIVADPLRYADAGIKNSSTESARNQHGNEVAFLKVRYKEPEQDKSQLIQQPINMSTQDNLSAEYQFSASVAWFAQVLRENQQIGSVSNADYRAIVEMATKAKGDDPFGYRGEFVNLVRTAAALTKS